MRTIHYLLCGLIFLPALALANVTRPPTGPTGTFPPPPPRTAPDQSSSTHASSNAADASLVQIGAAANRSASELSLEPAPHEKPVFWLLVLAILSFGVFWAGLSLILQQPRHREVLPA